MAKNRIKFDSSKPGVIWVIETRRALNVPIAYITRVNSNTQWGLFDRMNTELFRCSMLERAKAVALETYEDEDAGSDSHVPTKISLRQDTRFFSSTPFGNTFGVIASD